MTFNDKYKSIKSAVLPDLEKIENFMYSLVDIKEPLNTSVKNFLSSPSKRIRPVLSILYAKLSGIEMDGNILKALCAVEIIHNASLVHDDIIDESDQRRGEKTISYNFGNKLGVISGDYLLSLAMEIVSGLGSFELFKNFSHTLKRMCIGEINQNFGRFKIGSLEDYIEKSKDKTAYLFETAVLSPFILKGYADEDLKNASDFGINFGIAFQIRDDLMNVINTSEDSKSVNNDIKDGIYNAPVIFSQDVNNYMNGVEKTKDLLNNYINNARNCLFSDNKYRKITEDFLELLSDV